MKIAEYPSKAKWTDLLERPAQDVSKLFSTVQGVIDLVRTGGDNALRELEEKFDHVKLSELKVSESEFKEAETLLDENLKSAIKLAYENISRFHEAQKFSPIRVETRRGVSCEQRAVPIEKVGLYVPGGTAPLFSTVLMLATPAQIAGCRDIVLCTPPNKEGGINPAILFAARIAGVSCIMKVGGAQAIAAMLILNKCRTSIYL